ncbi:hypothetical protein CXB51_020917 [Gossypium anomalum]|uniref:Aminoacyl-tRNA synthetase class II (D/K/N) domain-containing protein n=1 Tax=Gossypium anomalum TaxID=47600 RepID=A0A8J5YY45_9ROSI|nr:hypothetical protein CXB51_020917 [Gossypium anomalum]
MNLTGSVENHAFSDRVLIQSIVGRQNGGAGLAGQRVRAGGWLKTRREQGKDGACPANLQVIMDAGVAVLSKLVATGTCVVVDGILKVPPEGTKQRIELRVEKVVHIGEVDPAKYPIPKTKLTLEFLRDHLHLRSRTNTNKSTLNSSIRNHIRTFVTDNMYGICYCNDMLPYKLRFGHHLAFAYFKVSNLQDSAYGDDDRISVHRVMQGDVLKHDHYRNNAIAQIRNALAFATHSFFQEHHFLYVHTPIITTSGCEGAGEMFQVTTLISEAEILEKDLIKNPPPLEADMEAAKQLVSERGLAVKQLKDAKASKADTGALFWMVEPEIAFADLQDDMNCAEAYVKYMCKWLLEKCLDDMEFMAKSYDKGCINRLKMVASTNTNLSIILYLTSWMIFK